MSGNKVLGKNAKLRGKTYGNREFYLGTRSKLVNIVIGRTIFMMNGVLLYG